MSCGTPLQGTQLIFRDLVTLGSSSAARSTSGHIPLAPIIIGSIVKAFPGQWIAAASRNFWLPYTCFLFSCDYARDIVSSQLTPMSHMIMIMLSLCTTARSGLNSVLSCSIGVNNAIVFFWLFRCVSKYAANGYLRIIESHVLVFLSCCSPCGIGAVLGA